MVVILLTFYLVMTSTLNLVGRSLYNDMTRYEMDRVNTLSVSFSGDSEMADIRYKKVKEAARQIGGRLLIVDMDGKVTFDSENREVGMLSALDEVESVRKGTHTSDMGFHQRSAGWIGCFVCALSDGNGQRNGVLVLESSIEGTVADMNALRSRLLVIFFLAATGVLISAALVTSLLTRPVKALSEGIEKMSRGDYQTKVHVPGHGEMAQLAAAFNEMTEKVHSLDQMRNEFVSAASHELKTPLATMKILLESVLYEENMDKEVRNEFLTDIDREIDRLNRVVSDLLTLVRIDSNKMNLSRENMLLSDTIHESVERLHPQIERKKQNLRVMVEDDCEMMGDPGKLMQVCYNLIGNAIKYTPEGGNIQVRLYRDGRDARMEVSDDGIGIPEEDIPHVFERFYRVDKSRAREGGELGGTGLGLSIVRQIVRLHAGSVTVRSELGKGTTFTVQLPMMTGGEMG